jgi:two-component sensor histidine kinase
MIKSLFLFPVLLLISLSSFAQIKEGQSLQQSLRLLKQSGKDSVRVKLLQELSHYYIFKPGDRGSDLDSALLLAKEMELLSKDLNDVSGQAQSYILFSQALREKKQEQKGKEYAEKAIEILNKQAGEEVGEAYWELSMYYSNTGSDLNEKFRVKEKALLCYKQSNNKEKEADIYLALADLYEIAAQPSVALVNAKQALKLYLVIGHKDLRGTYDLLGMISTSLGDYKEGVRYGLLAVKIAEAMGDNASDQMCTIYNRLGVTYFYLIEYQSALLYYKKAMLIARKLNDSRTIHTLTVNICNTYLKLNRPAEALALLKEIERKYPATDTYSHIIYSSQFMLSYEMLKQYEKAQQYCNEMELLLQKPNLIWEEKRLIYGTIIKYLLAVKQYPKLRKYMVVYEAENRKAGGIREMIGLERSWFMLDSMEGNYLSAIRHYQRYKNLNDSLFNDTKSKQIAQLQIQYETEKKDRDLKVQGENIQSLTQESLLQQAKLERVQLMRNVTFLFVGLLLVIVGLLYNRYMFKQRNNKKLETQQEEISRKNESLQLLVDEKDELLDEKSWLLKEIHHRVKNNLQIVMSLLNTQSAYLEDPAALAAIRESQNRVHSMSLIHQKLYQSENVSAVNMVAYIYELVDYLRDSFNSGNRIRFNLEIDAVELEVSQAVPIGLILNEAITNSIKYAFPNDADGIITISMEQKTGNDCVLTISDNGIGLPDDFDTRQSNSLGLSLMNGLSGDIDGSFTIKGNAVDGTSISISFERTYSIMKELELTTTA